MNTNKIIPDELLADEPATSSLFADLIADLGDDLWTEPKIFSEELEIHQDAVLKHLMDIVGKEISRLTKLQREVILRIYYRQESMVQLGKQLGVNWRSVQKLHNRAVNALHRRLSQNPYFIQLYKEFNENDPEVSELISIAEHLEAKK